MFETEVSLLFENKGKRFAISDRGDVVYWPVGISYFAVKDYMQKKGAQAFIIYWTFHEKKQIEELWREIFIAVAEAKRSWIHATERPNPRLKQKEMDEFYQRKDEEAKNIIRRLTSEHRH